MNYAIISPQGGINRITDKQPATVAENATVVEISEAQARQIKDGMAASPRVFYIYKDGELLTHQQWREQQIANRPKPAVTAERHIEREGFTAIRLVSLLDLENKLAQAGKTSPKLSAVRAWLDGVMASFAANPEPRNDWPKAPHGYEATVQEAAAALA